MYDEHLRDERKGENDERRTAQFRRRKEERAWTERRVNGSDGNGHGRPPRE